jgi:hypothetical protein
LLVLILAGILLSPFWAPALAPLFPWGEKPVVSAEEYEALAARVAAIEKRPPSPGLEGDAIKRQLTPVADRIDRLEGAVNARLAELEKRLSAPTVDPDAIKSANDALARRIDALEAGRQTDRRDSAAVAAAQTALQQLEQRVAGIEAQASSRTASATAERQQTQQELSRIAAAVADFSQRLPALERQVQSQGNSERKETMQTLLLLQIREAVDQGRPFQAEYAGLAASGLDPELASAVEPLAGPARNGVASRAVLSKRLAELAGRVANATEPAAEPDWGAQTLARIRGLVTIRRIEGASQTGPEAAVSAAQTALARDDLAEAVKTLEALTGANAEAARPWLGMARERLSAERALDRIQQLLTARLGSGSAAPAAVPPEPAAKSPS